MNLDKPYNISVYTIVRNDKGELLLLKRSKDSNNNPGKWDLPGGKMDLDETLKEALMREVREETGISIVPGEVAGHATYELPERKVIAIIVDGGYVTPSVKLSHEHTEYSWVPLDDVLEMPMLAPYLKDFFRRFVNENKEPF
jgi:8-oxo-dGTP diphosphatase